VVQPQVQVQDFQTHSDSAVLPCMQCPVRARLGMTSSAASSNFSLQVGAPNLKERLNLAFLGSIQHSCHHSYSKKSAA
jgi:hypothetical protein